jgi:hypothetical protein
MPESNPFAGVLPDGFPSACLEGQIEDCYYELKERREREQQRAAEAEVEERRKTAEAEAQHRKAAEEGAEEQRREEQRKQAAREFRQENITRSTVKRGPHLVSGPALL